MDTLFIDESCLVTPPDLFDPAVRALDKALAERGVMRGRGDDIKSTARIICSREDEGTWAADSNQGWATQYVRDSCKIMAPNSLLSTWESLSAVPRRQPRAWCRP